MKRRFCRRFFSLLLALLLLSMPVAAEEIEVGEWGTELQITFRDVHRPDVACSVPVLEWGGYFIRLEDILKVLNLMPVEAGYISPNRHLIIPADRLDLAQLRQLVYNSEPWYALDELMTVLDTAIFVADGEIYYNSLPVNEDLLLEETERIMNNAGYQADMLKDCSLEVIVGAFALDIAWNMRFDAVTGGAYADDIDAILLESLKHHDDNNSLLGILDATAENAEKTSSLLLKCQKEYADFYEGLELAVPGGEYLLFGMDGTGPLRETMEAVDALGDAGLSFSDILSTAAYIDHIGGIPAIYANALERVLDREETANFFAPVVLMEAEEILNIYRNHLEENRGELAAAGVPMYATDLIHSTVSTFTEDFIRGLAERKTGFSFSGTGASAITKGLLTVVDHCTLETQKKGDSFRSIILSGHVQQLFRTVYSGVKYIYPDGNDAIVLRDAATLHLKCSWAAYDTADFDEEIAGAIRRIQRQIDEELLLLAGFPDGMFCIPPNEPLPLGILSLHTEKTPPIGEEDKYHDSFLRFLQDGGHISYLQNDRIRQGLLSGEGSGNYYFHDIEKDGTNDLIVWYGTSGTDGELLVFTSAEEQIVCVGSAPCTGIDPAVFGSAEKTGLIHAEFDGDCNWYAGLDIAGGALTEVFPTSAIPLPKGWQLLEPVGRLPLQDTADSDNWGDAFEITALNDTFTMTIPGSWGQNYVVEEGEMGFTVCEKNNYDAGYGGELFTVYMSGYTCTEDIVEPNYQMLGRWAEGFILLATTPAYQAYNANDPQLIQTYQHMAADVPGILDSLRMN